MRSAVQLRRFFYRPTKNDRKLFSRFTEKSNRNIREKKRKEPEKDLVGNDDVLDGRRPDARTFDTLMVVIKFE